MVKHTQIIRRLLFDRFVGLALEMLLFQNKIDWHKRQNIVLNEFSSWKVLINSRLNRKNFNKQNIQLLETSSHLNLFKLFQLVIRHSGKTTK